VKQRSTRAVQLLTNYLWNDCRNYFFLAFLVFFTVFFAAFFAFFAMGSSQGIDGLKRDARHALSDHRPCNTLEDRSQQIRVALPHLAAVCHPFIHKCLASALIDCSRRRRLTGGKSALHRMTTTAAIPRRAIEAPLSRGVTSCVRDIRGDVMVGSREGRTVRVLPRRC
jgi:hypothetical protein